jgi:polar amino acid transport system permease protein
VGGIQSVPHEYIEVAVVCGVPTSRIYWQIKIPLAFRYALGPLTSSQVNVLHLSIFGSLISVDEIFRVSQRINSVAYKPVEVYTGLAVFFVIVCLPLNLLASRLRKRFTDRGWQ